MHLITAPRLLDGASGVLLVALGIYVAARTPRRPESLAFGIFSAGFGLGFVATNLLSLGDVLGWSALHVYSVATVIAILALVRLGLVWPAPLPHKDRGLLLVPAAVAVIFTAAGVFASSDHRSVLESFWDLGPAPLVAEWTIVLSYALLGTLWGLLLLLPRRFRAAGEGEEAVKRGSLLVSGALVLYPAFVAGGGLSPGLSIFGGRPGFVLVALAGLLLSAFVAVEWLRNTRDPAFGRAARNLAWLALAMPLFGLLLAANGGRLGPISPYGLLRTAAVVIFAYAILKHQVLGIDARVRWTISRGTVAAAFVAAFFLAGEGAQIVFGETNEWIGLAAAGALVFALAPLQRAAERFAAAAVPVAGPPSAAPNAGEAAYRAAVRLALRGGITRREERELALIAEAHGLTPTRALALRDEVEASTEARAP